tara:strand:- start:2143 stop:2673 length:531 start_codon:yes stop_codon:yes gene_type:complete
MAKRQYRTASGKLVDMDTLALRNEYTIAVGNMNVNARGDQLGEGGQIVKTREEIMAEHYATKGAVVPKQTNSREVAAPTIEADKAPVAPTVDPEVAAEKDLDIDDVEGTMEDPDPAPVGDEWVEDPSTGDFVKASEVEKPSTRGIASASAEDQNISVPFVESQQQKNRKKKGVKRL